MKTAGIIGGIGPESTVEYYRQIIATYREQNPDGSYPSIVLNSVNLAQVVAWITANELTAVTDYLVVEIERLARAGSDFAIVAANTPHIVFDEIRRRSPIPMISIVEATCQAAKALRLERLALFGTRFTMQGRFYPDVFSREGITLVIPDENDRAYLHEKYMGELLNGVVLPETRERLLDIVDKMKIGKMKNDKMKNPATQGDGIQGLILGGTELSLILRDPTARGVPVLDTTRIHVEAIVRELLS
jgi:aspartate racemase